ncbi:MAG TPA: VOC family protein [Candidatus Binataceae bacterium]|jgi:catechol-2,3-dioxygenase|nr:VOC family protein [Candidatus Binataceae bacterium]
MRDGKKENATPALQLDFLSHGTLESRDLAASRKFYEEFLGLTVVEMSPIALCLRLGGNHTLVVVKTNHEHTMPFVNHNGLDVSTPERVDACYRTVMEQKDAWGLRKITRPKEQHKSYSFYFWDADENCWEILANPPNGYAHLFPSAD